MTRMLIISTQLISIENLQVINKEIFRYTVIYVVVAFIHSRY